MLLLVLAREGWEKGVVGIAASRLSEDYFKPAILMNVSHDTAAGSVRSIEGIDIIRAIRQNAPYLKHLWRSSYGGRAFHEFGQIGMNSALRSPAPSKKPIKNCPPKKNFRLTVTCLLPI